MITTTLRTGEVLRMDDTNRGGANTGTNTGSNPNRQDAARNGQTSSAYFDDRGGNQGGKDAGARDESNSSRDNREAKASMDGAQRESDARDNKNSNRGGNRGGAPQSNP